MKQPELGKKISELRQAKGLTQNELAEKCNISIRTIQRIESAEVTPRSYTIKIIFSSLNYDIYNSFGRFSYRIDKLFYNIRSRFRSSLDLSEIFNLKTNTMKKISILAIIPVMAGLSLFIFNGESKAQSGEKLKEIIKESQQYFLQDFSKEQLDKLMVYYKDDACLFPGNYCGKESIKQHWLNEMSKGYQFLDLKCTSVDAGDKLAIEKGKWKIAYPGGIEISGHYITTWQITDNNWKITNSSSSVQSVNPNLTQN